MTLSQAAVILMKLPHGLVVRAVRTSLAGTFPCGYFSSTLHIAERATRIGLRIS